MDALDRSRSRSIKSLGIPQADGTGCVTKAKDGTMTDPRIIPCQHCGSEGRLYSGQYEDTRDCGPCPVCEGTGGEIIDTEPITMEDLEAENARLRQERNDALLQVSELSDRCEALIANRGLRVIEAKAALPPDLTAEDVKALFSLPDDDDSMHSDGCHR